MIAYHLILFTSGGRSNAVDVYNSATGTWSTAQLSLAREIIAATSVGGVALFVGGYAQSKGLGFRFVCLFVCLLHAL